MSLITIYLVKSVNLNNSGEDGKTNLQVFQDRNKAEAFKRLVSKQIKKGTYEYVAIEEFILEVNLNIGETV
jgi:predicted DNA-binding WGR domain protein